jgi:uncharacterized protein involved in type VI secretion and phage assembly
MNFFDVITDSIQNDLRGGRIHGVVVGIVTNNQDPDGLGRVKVKFPWLSDVDESTWARIAAPMAGDQRGVYFLPEVEDEVLVAFEHGDVRFPYVLGALWNGKDAPPASNDDEDGKETIEIVDKSEKNSILIDTAKNSIAVTSDKDITLSASNGTIKLDAQKIEINSSGPTKIAAGSTASVEASATLTVKGATVNIN